MTLCEHLALVNYAARICVSSKTYQHPVGKCRPRPFFVGVMGTLGEQINTHKSAGDKVQDPSPNANNLLPNDSDEPNVDGLLLDDSHMIRALQQSVRNLEGRVGEPPAELTAWKRCLRATMSRPQSQRRLRTVIS